MNYMSFCLMNCATQMDSTFNQMHVQGYTIIFFTAGQEKLLKTTCFTLIYVRDKMQLITHMYNMDIYDVHGDHYKTRKYCNSNVSDVC